MEADLASATAAEAMMTTTSAEAVDSRATVRVARTSEERASAESVADSRATARAAEISSAEESATSPTTTRIKQGLVKTSYSETLYHVPTI